MSRYRDRYDRYSYFEPSKTKYERIADAEKKKRALVANLLATIKKNKKFKQLSS